MADERDFVALIANAAGVQALVGSRVYAYPAPQEATYPFVTYFTVNGTENTRVTGASSSDRLLIQVDVLAITKSSAKAVQAAIEAALRQAADVRKYMGFRESYDQETDTHRVSLDYAYHAKR